jgi:hypothetical protein
LERWTTTTTKKTTNKNKDKGEMEKGWKKMIHKWKEKEDKGVTLARLFLLRGGELVAVELLAGLVDELAAVELVAGLLHCAKWGSNLQPSCARFSDFTRIVQGFEIYHIIYICARNLGNLQHNLQLYKEIWLFTTIFTKIFTISNLH